MIVIFRHTSGRTIEANITGDDVSVVATEARNWLNAQLASNGESVAGWHIHATRRHEHAVNRRAETKETR